MIDDERTRDDNDLFGCSNRYEKVNLSNFRVSIVSLYSAEHNAPSLSMHMFIWICLSMSGLGE